MTGFARSSDHSLCHLGGQEGVAHQSGAVTAFYHLGHRTAHVDIDHVRTCLFHHDGGGLLHTAGIAAKKLDGGGVLVLRQLHQGNGFFVLVAKGLGADHLGDGIARAHMPAMVRKARSVTPAMGARAKGEAISTEPSFMAIPP